MKTIQYFDILKRALLLTWKNKFLWIFGLFVFLGSIPSSFDLKTTSVADQNSQIELIVDFIRNHPYVFFAAALGMFVFAVILFALKIISTASITKAVNNIAVYSQSRFVGTFSDAKKYLWILLLLEITLGLSLGIIMMILFVPVAYLFAIGSKVLAIAFSLIAILIVLPLLVLAYYLRRYAYFFVVLGNMNMRMAMEASYDIFRKNLGESLVMGGVSLILNIASSLAAIASVLLLSVAIAPFGLVAYLIFAKTGAMIVLTIGVIIGIIVLLAIFAWFESFLQASWTLFFQEVAYQKKEEKNESEEAVAEAKIPSPEAV